MIVTLVHRPGIDEIDERIIFDSLDQEVEISSSTVNSDTLGTRFEFNRSQKDEGFDLSALLQFLHFEIRSRERASQIKS
ncbi:hypothetical protein TNCV_1922101 [Trichonephila clavipes]|nr:hypothetical protein TNCV_1922101 [Trichonephila clavipes]